MDVVIRDAALLGELRAAWVAAYLEALGWTRDGQSELFVRLRRPISDSKFATAFVPLRQDLDDYPLHMARVLEAASSLEKRSQLEILHGIEAIGHDLIALRDTTDASDGTTTLTTGRRMLAVAETSLRISAAKVVRRKPVNERKGKAETFLRSVRLGQTERGSFVQRILAPVPEPSPRQRTMIELGGPPPPLEREATFGAAKTIQAVNHAAHETFDRPSHAEEAFNAAGLEGVTQQLCTTLADAAEAARGDAIEISFSFTPLVPGTPPVEPIRVARPLVEPLRSGAKLLRTAKQPSVLGVEGWVVQLRREGDEPGRVNVIAQIRGGAPKAVAMTLDEQDYQIAIEAHRDGRMIRAMGALHEKQGRYQLEDVVSFRMISDSQAIDFSNDDGEE